VLKYAFGKRALPTRRRSNFSGRMQHTKLSPPPHLLAATAQFDKCSPSELHPVRGARSTGTACDDDQVATALERREEGARLLFALSVDAPWRDAEGAGGLSDAAQVRDDEWRAKRPAGVGRPSPACRHLDDRPQLSHGRWRRRFTRVSD